MNEKLFQRHNGTCELCRKAKVDVNYIVAPKSGSNIDEVVGLCSPCNEIVTRLSGLNQSNSSFLNESIWSEIPAIKIISWRLLKDKQDEGWASDLLDSIYLTEEELQWANDGYTSPQEVIVHKDSNGTALSNGDTVSLIKDLNVKGANFTAKRGTVVKNISLVDDNSTQIEGKVEGQQIVILTQFVKKQN